MAKHSRNFIFLSKNRNMALDSCSFVLTKHTPYQYIGWFAKLPKPSSIVVWIINDDLLFCERNVANDLKTKLKHCNGQNRPNACQILQLLSKIQVCPPCWPKSNFRQVSRCYNRWGPDYHLIAIGNCKLTIWEERGNLGQILG